MMDFIERVLFLLEQKGITKNKMLSDLKLGKNSFVNWKERGTIPSGETLTKIAEYFDVSVDYLLTGEKTEKPINYDELPSDIKYLVDIVKRLPNERALEVLGFAKAHLQSEQEKKQQNQ
jgi:transcriptional regulator with XRE-family HTH domain